MRAKGQLRVERDAEDLWGLDERNKVAAEVDLGMVIMLVGIRGEEGNARFRC